MERLLVGFLKKGKKGGHDKRQGERERGREGGREREKQREQRPKRENQFFRVLASREGDSSGIITHPFQGTLETRLRANKILRFD